MARISKCVSLLLVFACGFMFETQADLAYTFSFLEDKTGSYTLQDILAMDHEAVFEEYPDHARGFGIVASHFWVKLDIDAGNLEEEDIYLILKNHLLDSVELYASHVGRYQLMGMAGALVQHDYWDLSTNVPTFQLTGAAFQQPVFLRIRVSTLSNLPVRILDARAYFELEGKNLTLMGLFFGILSLFVLFNSLIFLYFRSNIFLVYIPFILTVILICTVFSGYAYRFFWPQAPAFNYIAPELAASLVTTLAVLLAKIVLKVREIFPHLRKLFRILTFVPIGMFVISFLLPKPVTVYLFNSVPQTIMIFLVVLSYFSWKKGNRAVLFFLLGWVSLLVGVLVFIARDFGLIPSNFFSDHFVLLSILVDVLMFSIAMAHIVSQNFQKRQKSDEALQEVSGELDQLKKQIQTYEEADPEHTLDRINLYLKESLSRREMEVLEQLIAGKKNKEISEILFISENTIKKHVGSIYRKLEVNNRAQLSTKALTLANQKK